MQQTPILPAPTMACPQCATALAPGQFGSLVPLVCPQCQVHLRGVVFPAFWQSAPTPVRGGDKVHEGESSCFFHAENKAALACDRCGRFICKLCEVELGPRRLCPTCLGSGLRGTSIPELLVSRFCWGNFALLMGGLPLLGGIFLWPLFIISGPLPIFAAIYGWRKPGSLIHGSRRWAAVLGAFCGLLQLVAWLGMVGFLWKAST